ncbi:hypothetical protein Q765_03210 [Flavobacterium rivuli WB 3.3-2 = DSM 21788]|uniref:Uncharacterized protein n=1 Tax=Flavobacterium rivuli WB 3.3-2 = DSM 21788 TaxID=1121895 RepID=A0A0A2M719_9FLAO|nr:hypothetical protein [Flavobacterium rivuli]KGO88079.1 hypothetical protein Q765_03210 [Flavobacterium rivuli WB 3.3-2 = DSM 21788]
MSVKEFFKIDESGKLHTLFDDVVNSSIISFTDNLTSAILVISNHWERSTGGDVIARVEVNDTIVLDVPGHDQHYTNSLDLLPYLNRQSNTLKITFLIMNWHVWKNQGAASLIIDGHNIENITFNAGGDHQKVHVIIRTLNN